MTDFEKALSITLKFEGGWADDPDDPGGQTMMGVTQKTYDDYRLGKGLPHASVHEITDDELHQIYYAGYWAPSGCDNFIWPLSACVFDFAVNSGVSRAMVALQTIIGANADGRFGPVTRGLVQQQDPATLAVKLNAARRQYLAAIVAQNPRLQKFFPGWTKRVAMLEREVLPATQSTQPDTPEPDGDSA